VSLQNGITNEDAKLDAFFQEYRAACPEPDPSPQFMPLLWQKIEARQSFWYVFQRSGRAVTTASAALCLLLLVLNLVTAPGTRSLAPSYADALMADHSAEKTYYTEAIRNSIPGDANASQPVR
jgi:hypothetical protein